MSFTIQDVLCCLRDVSVQVIIVRRQVAAQITVGGFIVNCALCAHMESLLLQVFKPQPLNVTVSSEQHVNLNRLRDY